MKTISEQADELVRNINDALSIPRPPRPKTMAEIERRALLDSLSRHKGNIVAAAAELQISRNTIYRRLIEMGIPISRGAGL